MRLVSLRRDRERGTSAIEYAVLAAIMSVTLIAVLPGLTGAIQGGFTHMATQLDPNADIFERESTLPLTSPWIPPSWVTATTGDPAQVRQGLSGEDPHVEAESVPQLSTVLICQPLRVLGTTEIVQEIGFGSAAAATCPDSSAPIGIVVNGDVNLLDGGIADLNLSDYLGYYASFGDWRLESSSAGCSLRNSTTTIPLLTSDCDTARAEGLFG